MLKFMSAKVIEVRVENSIVKKLLALLTVGTQLKTTYSRAYRAQCCPQCCAPTLEDYEV